MAEQKEKEEDIWELFYWPAQNRGNHFRLLFLETGAAFKNVMDFPSIQAVMRSSLLMPSKLDTSDESQIFHVMAPPIIRKGNFVMSQTLPMLQYLSMTLNFRPKSDEDNALGAMIMANMNDFQDELRPYAAGKPGLLQYLNGRADVWLDIVERPLRLGKEKQFYFDDKCTCVDLVVYNVMEGYRTFLGCQQTWNELVKDKHPVLHAHYLRISQRETVQKLLKEQQDKNIVWWPPGGYPKLKESVHDVLNKK